MATDERPGDVAAARLRRSGSLTLKLPPGALPAIGCGVQYDRVEPHHAVELLPLAEKTSDVAIPQTLRGVLTQVLAETSCRDFTDEGIHVRQLQRSVG